MTAGNNAAIRKTVFLTAKPGLQEELRRALIELQNATRPEPGCRFFTFYQALDDSSSFVLVEDFANAEAMETHMGLPHTKSVFRGGAGGRIQGVHRCARPLMGPAPLFRLRTLPLISCASRTPHPRRAWPVARRDSRNRARD